MKMNYLSFFFIFTISLYIYSCKSQEVIKPTNYTLSYLENLETYVFFIQKKKKIINNNNKNYK